MKVGERIRDTENDLDQVFQRALELVVHTDTSGATSSDIAAALRLFSVGSKNKKERSANADTQRES